MVFLGYSISHIKLDQPLSQKLRLDNNVSNDDDDDDDNDKDEDEDDCGKCQGVAAQSCFYKNSTHCIRNEWVSYDDADDDDDAYEQNCH